MPLRSRHMFTGFSSATVLVPATWSDSSENRNMTQSRRLAFLSLAFAVAVSCAPTSVIDDGGASVVQVEPSDAQVAPSGRITFSAVGAQAATITWSILEGSTGGSITGDGLYTAPASTGEYHVVATSAAAPSVTGSAVVTVTPTPVVGITISPTSTSVTTGRTASFTASVTGTSNTAVSFGLQETSGCGSVSSGGVYTAPSTPTTCHVIATAQADPTKKATATVTVTAAPVVAITISPTSTSVTVGGTVTFTATITGTSNTTAIWTVQETSGCGAVSSTGVYTAPSSPTTCHVIATAQADSTRKATATVTVTAASTLASQLAVLAGKSVFFGHQSVGGNILTGIQRLLDSNSGSEPTIDSSRPPGMVPGPGVITQVYIGSNFDPISKINAFKSTLDGTVHGRVLGSTANIAFMKLCFVDFDSSVSYFNGGGTVSTLFAAYRAKVAEIKTAYPNLRIVHFTAPLRVSSNANNVRREQYNALVRAAYGGPGQDPLLDIALLESTVGSDAVVGSDGAPALYDGYASDDGHLNSTGADKVARALVALLAGL